MSEVTREHLAGLELALNSGAITSPDMQESIRKMIAQASAAPEQEPAGMRFRRNDGKDRAWTYAEAKAPDSFELREYEIENLYTHADPSEVEQLRADLKSCWAEFKALVRTSGETEKYLNAQLEAATQRADAAERKLGEAVGLLREAAFYAGRLEPMSASCLIRIDALLDASAEPAKGGDGENNHE